MNAKSLARRRDLALTFNELTDVYLERQDWDTLQAMEREWLEAYGSIKDMQRVIDDYVAD